MTMTTAPTAPIPVERKKNREFVIKSQKALIETYSWECCLNCEEWAKTSSKRIEDPTKYSGWREEQTGPKCKKYDMLPPPEVIVNGCEEWVPVIPF